MRGLLNVIHLCPEQQLLVDMLIHGDDIVKVVKVVDCQLQGT